jgi:cyanophycin synthetase
MGEAGDLLLIFADALVRSWKQITKFKPSGTAPPRATTPTPRALGNANGNGSVTHGPGNAPSGVQRDPDTTLAAEPAPDFSLEGLIRDERGIRMAPETEDCTFRRRCHSRIRGA